MTFDGWARTVVVLDDLPDAVRRERLARGESIRSAARQIGVHFSILDRFEKRATAANLPTVKRMLTWLANQPSEPTYVEIAGVEYNEADLEAGNFIARQNRGHDA